MIDGFLSMESAPHDGTDILLLIRHKNYELSPSPKWEELVVGRWINHNGGGWTYHGLYGRPVAWRPCPQPMPVREEGEKQ